MRKPWLWWCLSVQVALGLTVVVAAAQVKYDALPEALSGNAVTGVRSHGEVIVYSFMGMGKKKTWDDVSNAAYLLDPETGKWHLPRPVPGTAGRIDAVAVAARGHVFLLGGSIVTAQGREMTVTDVNVYEPDTDRWFRGTDIPVPVDYAVAGVYRDRYIYLVGGRSQGAAVDKVQVYDAEKNKWLEGTPLPAGPVFGHAGAVLEDTIVFVGGASNNAAAKPAYIASEGGWMGKIDHHDPEKIQWTKLEAYPGSARFGIAAGGSDKDDKVYFSGGSDKPYNHTGMGYDGTPAEAAAGDFAFNLRTGKWETLNSPPEPAIGARGLIVMPQSLLLIGGMAKAQQVTAAVTVLSKESKPH